MSWHLSDWPVGVVRLLWTVLTIGVAYGIGHLVNALVVARLARMARWTESHLDDVVVAELRRRVPFWALLIGVWVSLDHWPLQPHLLALATKVLFAFGVASVTLAASAVAVRSVAIYGPRQTPTMPVTGLTQNVAKIIVLVLGALVILNGLGVSITPYLAALGVGGLAVALALQDPLYNLFAGILISLAGQIRLGDYIKAEGGIEGVVSDVSWRATQVRMLSNNVILVPNAKLAQAVVVNYDLPEPEQAVVVEVGADFASDLATVERVTIDVAREVMRQVEGGVPTFEPLVRYHTFADPRLNFSVIMRGRTFVDQFLIKHEFIKRLQARYAQEGIVIPFTARAVAAK
jgi:small-conductance mechanosensitive channel